MKVHTHHANGPEATIPHCMAKYGKTYATEEGGWKLKTIALRGTQPSGQHLGRGRCIRSGEDLTAFFVEKHPLFDFLSRGFIMILEQRRWSPQRQVTSNRIP